MTHNNLSDAYRSIKMLAATGCRPKLIVDRHGFHVGIIPSKKETKK